MAEDDIILEHMSVANGNVEIAASHPMFSALVDAAVSVLEAAEAPNFVALSMYSKDRVAVDVVVQYCKGESLADQMKRIKEENTQLKSALEVALETI